MALRPKICDVIDLIDSSLNWSLSMEEKDKKIATYHIGLDGISDEEIEIGLVRCLQSDTKEFPTPGQFRELCKKSNPAKQYICQSDPDFVPPADHALNNKNLQFIIDRLKLPEKLKQNEFKDFKKNRKTIESNRKERVKNASLRILHRD